jgi:DNA-binding CsgD family transcriptional regulator
MPDSDFYLGTELDRTVNRMDFFRLFKALALHYDAQYFLLSPIEGENAGVSVQHEHSLYSLADDYSLVWKSSSGAEAVFDADSIVMQAKRSTVPFFLPLAQHGSDLIVSSECKAATIVPLHTLNAKRYYLILFGDGEPPSRERLALIALDAASIFQRYDEVIVSLDSIAGLSDREIEVVRWTSEGKTSTEIAIILGLSAHTVNTYIAIALRKLGVVNRAQMVASALRRGLIT